MANEGSTKPTYSELVALNESASAVFDAIFKESGDDWRGNEVCTIRHLKAELARVRGLLQRLEWSASDGDGCSMCPVCEAEGGVPVDPHADDCWLAKELSTTFPQSFSLVPLGAESADIGKLDRVEEKSDV